MKNKIIIVMLLILFFPIITYAETKDVYVNECNVEMPIETYNNLRKIYSELAVDMMSLDEYNKILELNLDFNNVHKITKYYKTTYNQITGEVTTEEVSKESINTSAPKTTSYLSTAYKSLTLSVSSGTTSGIVSESLVWLNMPSVRSYDVIGLRFINASVISGTQSGKQIYTQGGVNYQISYAYNGTNINNQTNGFGISMNLVDPTITHLENVISSTVTFSSGSHSVFGAYEHATSSVSLAISKNYQISASGLGNVFAFNNGYSSYYDNMTGVQVNF